MREALLKRKITEFALTLDRPVTTKKCRDRRSRTTTLDELYRLVEGYVPYAGRVTGAEVGGLMMLIIIPLKIVETTDSFEKHERQCTNVCFTGRRAQSLSL